MSSAKDKRPRPMHCVVVLMEQTLPEHLLRLLFAAKYLQKDAKTKNKTTTIFFLKVRRVRDIELDNLLLDLTLENSCVTGTILEEISFISR